MNHLYILITYLHINQISMMNVWGLLWVIILNTALAYALYVWLLRKMSVVSFTFGGIANPIAGIVMGMVLMSESFTTWQYFLMVSMILMSLFPALLPILIKPVLDKYTNTQKSSKSI